LVSVPFQGLQAFSSFLGEPSSSQGLKASSPQASKFQILSLSASNSQVLPLGCTILQDFRPWLCPQELLFFLAVTGFPLLLPRP
jgi:hypothetical protein